MKQKLFFLMLTLIMLSAASVQAQVTIGADEPPHSAAVLDLQSNLGLKLPTVALNDVSVFQLLEADNENIATATGITVYNSSDETIGGSGKGIYVWEGKWIFVGKSAPVDVPVTKITIASENNVTAMYPGGNGLQLTAMVEPANASNKTLNWTIVYNPSLTAGSATIDQNGLITGVKPGNVTARASATDGSGAYRNFVITVRATGFAESITVTSETGITYVDAGKSLQLIAEIMPITALQVIDWSVDDSELASISTDGILSGLNAGTVTATAATVVGPLASGSIQIEVRPISAASTTPITMDGIEYQSYTFGDATWMVENSKAGTYTYDMFDGNPERPTMYYSWAQSPSACLDGWHLPSREDILQLIMFIDVLATEEEANLWLTGDALSGYVTGSGWQTWGTTGRWWSSTADDTNTYRLLDNMGTLSYETVPNRTGGTWRNPVRCVKDEE
jgi:uncharacterized protein (TIGR02145 family)